MSSKSKEVLCCSISVVLLSPPINSRTTLGSCLTSKTATRVCWDRYWENIQKLHSFIVEYANAESVQNDMQPTEYYNVDEVHDMHRSIDPSAALYEEVPRAGMPNPIQILPLK